MEYRFLGRSGLKISVLNLGGGTFGGEANFFRAWGEAGWGIGRNPPMEMIPAGLNA